MGWKDSPTGNAGRFPQEAAPEELALMNVPQKRPLSHPDLPQSKYGLFSVRTSVSLSPCPPVPAGTRPESFPQESGENVSSLGPEGATAALWPESLRVSQPQLTDRGRRGTGSLSPSSLRTETRFVRPRRRPAAPVGCCGRGERWRTTWRSEPPGCPERTSVVHRVWPAAGSEAPQAL